MSNFDGILFIGGFLCAFFVLVAVVTVTIVFFSRGGHYGEHDSPFKKLIDKLSTVPTGGRSHRIDARPDERTT